MSVAAANPAFRAVDAVFYAAAANAAQMPPPTIAEFAFCGRSNVGKSSLLNGLMSRRGLARTSSTPGCTRQVVFFDVRLGDGLQLRLVDLPGYGYAQRSKTERKEWANLIESYLLERATLVGAAVLVDGRRGIEAEEESVLELLADRPRVTRRELGVVVVATKLDKLTVAAGRTAVERLRSAKGAKQTAGFSTENTELVPELWRRLRLAAELAPIAPSTPST